MAQFSRRNPNKLTFFDQAVCPNLSIVSTSVESLYDEISFDALAARDRDFGGGQDVRARQQ